MRFFALFAAAALSSVALSAPFELAERTTCINDECLDTFLLFGELAKDFCEIYTYFDIPAFEIPEFKGPCGDDTARVSSACHCLTAPGTTSTTKKPTTTTTKSIITTTSTTPTLSSPAITSTTTTPSTAATASTITTLSPTTASTSSSITAPPTTIFSNTSSIVSSTVATTTAPPCLCTNFTQISAAVASCTTITLQDIYAPPSSSIDLSKLQASATVIFSGTTTFGFTNSSTFNPIVIAGESVLITGAPGSIIDGNGQAYWDGQGSNGGVPKPDHMLSISKMTAGSVIQDLYIRNYPVHCFSISNCADFTLRNIYINNTEGDAPNAISAGLPAAHNSDGFDLSTCNNTLITSSTVYNQDDCVAITSGNNITVDNLYCSGGHGMSIGSVGGKSNNNVTNIVFSNSEIINSQNGARIKTNYNTTGYIANITYTNIAVSDISIYGIDVQQDYLNGGPTGIPSNGVIITDLLFNNITGTALSGALDYYILCGNGSCSDFTFTDVDIYGGTNTSYCNYPPSGCPGP